MSDALGMAAHPLPALQRGKPEADLAHLRDLVEDRGVARIILGLPLEMHGAEGPMAREVRAFGATLEAALGLPVVYEDERLTTDEAEERLRETGMRPSDRKRRRDSVAAAVILEAVLRREENAGPAADGPPADAADLGTDGEPDEGVDAGE